MAWTALFAISLAAMIALGLALRTAIAELAAARDVQEHLSREIQDRVQLMLTIIQGLASSAYLECDEPAVAFERFAARLRALSLASDLVDAGGATECKLPELAIRALDPFMDAGRIHLFGPCCILPAESCVSLTLALHQLAASALERGVLGHAGSSIDVGWSFTPRERGKVQDLVVQWTEQGSPKAAISATRESEFLKPQPGIESVEHEVRGEGVRCRLLVVGATRA